MLYRLHKHGYQAFLVGGGVRDILLGKDPKDFDVATNATPEQIKALFSNCRLIGRRFRLAHILFGRDVIEVATFRGDHSQAEGQHQSKQSDQGMLLRDNVYGSIEEDAERRDFTINALYYNIADFSIHAFAGGLHDLEQKTLRMVGDPEVRYREDPVRMLRAVRFAGKLNMDIAPETEAPIRELSGLLQDIPAARLFEETLKLFMGGAGLETFRLMRQYRLFLPLFPQLKDHLRDDCKTDAELLIEAALRSTDERVRKGRKVTPAFLYAAFLWYPLDELSQQYQQESGLNDYDALMLAMNDVLDRQIKSIAIPRRFTSTIREIWQLQPRLPKRSGKRALRLMEHKRFRAAYDFLLMRGEQNTELARLAQWWTDFQQQDENGKNMMLKSLGSPAKRSNRRRRPKNRQRSQNQQQGTE